MKASWVILGLLIICPLLSFGQQTEPLRQRITARPVMGFGGEHVAGGFGLIGEYGYQFFRRGATIEAVFQVGGFGDNIAQPQTGRRDYRFRSLLTGIGLNVGTRLIGPVFAKLGAGIAYHHGNETYNFLTNEQKWEPVAKRYREPVFNASVELGVRFGTRWEGSIRGALFGPFPSDDNVLLLIGPGLSRRF